MYFRVKIHPTPGAVAGWLSQTGWTTSLLVDAALFTRREAAEAALEALRARGVSGDRLEVIQVG